MKLFSICKTCNKRKFLIKKRTFRLPKSRETATNRDEICGRCARGLKGVIAKMIK